MGVYEGHNLSSPSMHWQQERHQMLAAAYDPSRDLSPNLPCQESSDSGSGCSSSSVSSGCCKSEFTPCRDCSPEPRKEEVVCAGCNHRITDRFYLYAVDLRWHASCLQCSQCRVPLDGEVTCFARDGRIFCKKDYYRLFGTKRCARCQATISSSELVMRARDLVFHVHCFTCAACSALLTKGDTFGMRDGAVFCRLHYAELPPLSPYPQEPTFPHEYHHPRLTSPHPPQPPAPPEPVKIPNAFFPNGAPAPRQKGRPRKRKPKDLEGMTANLDLNAESYLDVAFGPGTPGLPGANGSHHTRTKRMRTSFKHHQLRTMKSYFAINHNPDAKDLKQLSQKTGLPKRVLQVWFQNARAKWRRMVLKQEGGNGKDKLGEGPGSLEGYHHSLGPHGSPYLSPSPLECSS
ncbi:protein apterous isoform X1 [Halyomorpha halys]|uniref:protein apterous isoform X1 n=1 Tax=Halyomorpha halys TaxID=286706 RepID=UPI0006D4CA65|nr:protein apterous-like isoform X1 [Halyomorpha halys]XP_014279788.1 protein apterous-like isoform X1 [Halyomorpha halys]